MKNKIYTRRDFLKNTTAGAVMLGLSGNLLFSENKKSKVVLIRHKDLFNKKNKLQTTIVQDMLDEAVTILAGKQDRKSAWKTLFTPDDIVGIKSNEWSYLPTPTELENAIYNRVRECDVDGNNISIDDKGILSNSVFKKANALVNVRPLRTHYWSGVGSLIKNYIMFVDRPSEYHNDTCADLAAIWKLPHVKGKTRLNILVMFTPLFHGTGAHHFNPAYMWSYNGMLVGFDPVAVDTIGVQILSAKRKSYFKEERPINPPPKHIFLADKRHNLGTSDLSEIELIKRGWQDNSLI